MSEKESELSITCDWKSITPRAFYDVYDSVNFGLGQRESLPERYMQEAFPPGVYGVFALAGDTLVGAARVFSDDKYCSWIAEICVKPEWQSRGVGGLILDEINRRFRHTAVYADVFREQVEFFAKRSIRPKAKLIACSRAPFA